MDSGGGQGQVAGRTQEDAGLGGGSSAEARAGVAASISTITGLSGERVAASGLENATPEGVLAAGYAAVIGQAAAWHRENAQRGMQRPVPAPRLRTRHMKRLVGGLARVGRGGTDSRCLGLAALALLSGWNDADVQRMQLPGARPPCEKGGAAGLFRLVMGYGMPVDGEAALHDVLVALDAIPDAGARIRRRLGEPALAALAQLDDTGFDGMAAELLARAWGLRPGWRLADGLFQGLTNGLPRRRQLGILAGGLDGGLVYPWFVPAQGDGRYPPMGAEQALTMLDACAEWLEARAPVPACEAHGGAAGDPLYRFPHPGTNPGVIRGAGALAGVLAGVLRADVGGDRHSDRLRRLAERLAALSDEYAQIVAASLLATGDDARLRGAGAGRGQRRRG